VVLLVVVTLGVYGYVWWWRTSGGLDRHQMRRYAHPIMRWGVVLSAAAGAVAIVAAVMAFGAVWPLVGLQQGDPLPDVSVGLLAATMVLFVVVFLVGLPGAVLSYIGYWRTWAALRDGQRASGLGPVVDPTVLLLVVLLAPFGIGMAGGVAGAALQVVDPVASLVVQTMFSLAGQVPLLWAIHRTQSRLNGLWDRLGPPGPGAAMATSS